MEPSPAPAAASPETPGVSICEAPAVSICIVSWNTRDLLHECLASVEARTRIAHEVVVVDNASSDGTPEMVRTLHPRVKLVAAETNLGFVGGTNLAARRASGEYLLLLNPDTVLVTDAVGGLHRLLSSDPTIGVAGCRLLNADGSVQKTCAAAFPTPRNELTSLLLLHRLSPRLFPDRELSAWDHLDDRDVECLSGACMMIRRSTWESLGGFDERIFMYAEDLDLCRRVRQAGLRVRYLASESIVHKEGSASGRRRETFFSLISQMSSNEYFLAKHFGRGRALAYRGAVLVGSAARLVGGVVGAPFVRRLSGQGPGRFLRRSWALMTWAVGARRAA